MSVWRSRWAAIGAAVAVSLGSGGLGLTQAAISSGEKPVVVTVDAARVLDTRTGVGLAGRFTDSVPRDLRVTGNVPVAPSGTATVVPADAIGVLVNVTVVAPSSNGFLSLRAGGAAGVPATSTVNFVAGVNTPNAATVDLSGDGKIQVWVETDADGGTAHVLVDVVGYTVDHTHNDIYYTEAEVNTALGAKANIADVYTKAQVENLVFDGTIPSGVTVTGNVVWDSHGSTDTTSDRTNVDFPGRAPLPLTSDKVNFNLPGITGDGDPQCTGTVLAPTAPAGKVCIYLESYGGMAANTLEGYAGWPLADAGFFVSFYPNGADDVDQYVFASWAYTAP